ncbi:bud site selection protein 21-like [Pecten maximus]|uniref:bud site selection protein 21-like n=1 Tax=Pecten maximus TaxID=6579 RepID=UPI001458DB03|nr:bud site selection protein 21-like [Pecten maximus]
MSRRYSSRKVEDDEFESEIFKDIEKKTEDKSGTSGSENESVESESSENENLLVESDEEYDGDIVGATIERTGMDHMEDSDGDDAPETVSFQSGKDNALQKMKQVMKQIDTEKIALKTKRRQLDQQYKEQKKRKLEKLSKSKLPEDFFNDLPEKLSDVKSKSSSKNKRVSSIADEEEGSLADTEEDFDVSKNDFIPLDNNRLSGIEVSTVQIHHQKAMSSKCRAEDFRTARLSNVPRHSSKAYFATLEKKKALKKGLRKDFMIK